MVKRDLNVGGEQSGHMIFRDFTTTGDGIISALQILRIMRATGKPLSELKRCLTKYPQAQRNLRVKEKPPLEELPAVMKLVGEAEAGAFREGPRAAALLGNGAEDPAADRRPRAGADRSAGESDCGRDSKRDRGEARPDTLNGSMTLVRILEALLFSAQKPLTPRAAYRNQGRGRCGGCRPERVCKDERGGEWRPRWSRLKIEYIQQGRAISTHRKEQKAGSWPAIRLTRLGCGSFSRRRNRRD